MTETSLSALAGRVADGDVVAFGGKTLHRAPMALVRELARAGHEDFTLVGLAKSMDVDLLCGLDRVRAVHYGYVGFEWLGLAPSFRRGAEAGSFRAVEGTCYSVATMLRAAKQGVPFLPLAGLDESDLTGLATDVFATVEDPFSGEPVTAVRRLRPDVGVIHATEADTDGNARIAGADLTEGLVARAAETVLVTAERIVPTERFVDAPERTTIPGVLVDAVAEVPYGAHPTSCPGAYDYDTAHLRNYLEASAADDLPAYLATTVGGEEAAYRERVIGARDDELSWADAVGPAAAADP